MNKDWLAVFEALKAVYTDGAYSNMSINEAVSRHRGCRESFVRTFAKGTLRDTIRLDYIIDSLSAKGIKSIKQRPLIILRMGIYATDSLGSVPEYAAVSEAVGLSKAVAKGSSSFINGMLRAYLRQSGMFEKDLLPPHIRYSFSEPVFSLLTEQYGEEIYRLAEALNTPPEVYIRVNTLKTERDDIMRILTEKGIDAEASTDNSEAVRVSGSGIASDRLNREGMYTIQSLSSMMAVKALGPIPGSCLLDMCAAPGGKTGYAAELMKNSGRITACDVHPHRLELTEANMKRIGADIVELRLLDASVHDQTMDDSFDFVIADVPCSGLGVCAGKPEIKITTDPSRYASLIEIQKDILSNAIRYAKPGGRVMYSTCTLNKNENENVVKHVLSKEHGLARILEMNTLLPYNGKVGFFYSIIGKTGIINN